VWLYVRLFENFVFETRAAALDFDAMLGLCKLLLGLVVRSHFAMCSARPVPGSPTDSRAGKSEGLFILNAVRNGGVGGVGGAKRKNESERSKKLPRKLAAYARKKNAKNESAESVPIARSWSAKEPPGKLSRGVYAKSRSAHGWTNSPLYYAGSTDAQTQRMLRTQKSLNTCKGSDTTPFVPRRIIPPRAGNSGF
jgi:hypothetical protein